MVFITVKNNIDEADIDQSILLVGLKGFNDRVRPKTVESENKKRSIYKSAYALCQGRELILNAFRSGIFPIKIKEKD